MEEFPPSAPKWNLFLCMSERCFRSGLTPLLFSAGLLVFGDHKDGSRNITLRTRYILIKDGGALHIGAEKCRYASKATIALYGKSDEGESMPTFGKKFIGVEAGGTLELHGAQKASWTLLARTLHASGLTYGAYAFEKNFSRGLNVRVIDQDTAKILESERFDTHEYHNESRRLQEFLRAQDPGRIVAIAVGDSAAKSLLQGTIQMIQDRLGSKLIQGLGYRWAYRCAFSSSSVWEATSMWQESEGGHRHTTAWLQVRMATAIWRTGCLLLWNMGLEDRILVTNALFLALAYEALCAL